VHWEWPVAPDLDLYKKWDRSNQGFPRELAEMVAKRNKRYIVYE
jgi:hypothetical protein